MLQLFVEFFCVLLMHHETITFSGLFAQKQGTTKFPLPLMHRSRYAHVLWESQRTLQSFDESTDASLVHAVAFPSARCLFMLHKLWG